ncbi:MAG: DUF1684 domain-containing protein [Candidatus Latescibacteria bacterium]|nr:DUF1684 domain-containing protein [Candidatus Latescibacterota bacterium]
MRSLLCFLFVFFACTNFGLVEETEYTEKMNRWHAKRLASLQKPTGWLSLAGLFWLAEGENTVGSHATSDVIFPADMPAHFGLMTLQDGVVSFQAIKGVDVFFRGQAVEDIVLQTDATDDPTVLTSGTYQWYVIVRGGKYGIRLKNTAHPNRLTFKGIDRFKVDEAWRIKAKFEAYDPPQKIEIPNVLGTVSEEMCVGALRFEVGEKIYSLDPLGSFDDEAWFVIFSDETSGNETYGAGRFLSVSRPDSLGTTFIDFNKAYNPPCAFTEFATCPLPPEQNKLSVRILAGEEAYGHH